MTAYPKLVDFSGWLLVGCAGLAAVIAIVGAGAVLYASSPSGIARAEQELHDVHYVVYPNWTAVFAFAICLLLACGIGFLGYSQTKQFVERRISTATDDVANGNQPDGADRNGASPSTDSRR
jgi:hypothetical protein